MITSNICITDVPKADLDQAIATARKVVKLGEELKAIFPERGDLVNQICYALLTREHVLVHGRHGTGKSDLVTTLFSMITGSIMFSVNLTKFMTEGPVIGIPNTKKMRDEGIIEHELDGTIVHAHFAELDEIFDASAPLLRVLLSILNERQFKRGRQCEHAYLHTAIASTNGEPEDVLAKSPELAAVIDRFLFQGRVDYLDQPESRRQMYDKYLTGAKPTVQLNYPDLEQASNIVVCANQIIDPYFIQVYDVVVQALRVLWPNRISDRRACKMMTVCEANALMFGRGEVALEDIEAIEWCACNSGVPEEHRQFHETVDPILTQAAIERPVDMDKQQIELLSLYEQQVPVLDALIDNDRLVDLVQEANALLDKVKDVVPQLPSTLDKQNALAASIENVKSELWRRIEGRTI